MKRSRSAYPLKWRVHLEHAPVRFFGFPAKIRICTDQQHSDRQTPGRDLKNRHGAELRSVTIARLFGHTPRKLPVTGVPETAISRFIAHQAELLYHIKVHFATAFSFFICRKLKNFYVDFCALFTNGPKSSKNFLILKDFFSKNSICIQKIHNYGL